MDSNLPIFKQYIKTGSRIKWHIDTTSAVRRLPDSMIRTLWSTALRPHRDPAWAETVRTLPSPGTAVAGENCKDTWNKNQLSCQRTSLLPVWSGVMLEHIIPGFGNMFQCQKMHYQPQHSHWAKRSRPESAPLEPYWHWQKAGTTQSRSRLYQKPLLEPSEIHDGQSHLWTRPYRRQIAWSTRSVQSSRVENRCPLTI